MIKIRPSLSPKFLIVLFMTALLFQTAAWAEDEFDSKIALERHLEDRLRTALTEVTGSDKIIVAVNADIELGKSRSGGGGGGGRKGTLTRKEDTNALVLPGVPAKKEIGKSPNQTAELSLPEGGSGGGGGAVMVRRLAVTILLDKGVSAEMLGVVKDVASSIVDFNQARGDKLDIKQMSISKMNFRWSSFFYPPHLYWLILVIMASFFLIAAALFLMNPYIKLAGGGSNVKVDLIKEAAGSLLKGGAPAAAEPAAEALVLGQTQGVAAKEENEKTGQPFSFIREKHLRDLSFLLSKESPRDTALIVNYLEPDLAIRLLQGFPGEKQAEIAASLTNIEEVHPEKLTVLEEKIKDRIGYLVGGEDKVAGILDLIDDEVKDKVFSILDAKDASAAKRLRSKVRDLDSYMRELSPAGIQAIYRQMDQSVFAQVLKSFPDDIRNRVMESMSAGAAELLKQQMDLNKPLPAVRLKNEKRNIMLVIRRMIREGILEVGNN